MTHIYFFASRKKHQLFAISYINLVRHTNICTRYAAKANVYTDCIYKQFCYMPIKISHFLPPVFQIGNKKNRWSGRAKISQPKIPLVFPDKPYYIASDIIGDYVLQKNIIEINFASPYFH